MPATPPPSQVSDPGSASPVSVHGRARIVPGRGRSVAAARVVGRLEALDVAAEPESGRLVGTHVGHITLGGDLLLHFQSPEAAVDQHPAKAGTLEVG